MTNPTNTHTQDEATIAAHNAAQIVDDITARLDGIENLLDQSRGLLADLAVYLPKVDPLDELRRITARFDATAARARAERR